VCVHFPLLPGDSTCLLFLFNSDARSGQVVDERIRPTLECGAAVGSSKPVLMVVDEIDGATGGGETVCCYLLFFIVIFASRLTFFLRLIVDVWICPEANTTDTGESEKET
jgi:hypothetical protein